MSIPLIDHHKGEITRRDGPWKEGTFQETFLYVFRISLWSSDSYTVNPPIHPLFGIERIRIRIDGSSSSALHLLIALGGGVLSLSATNDLSADSSSFPPPTSAHNGRLNAIKAFVSSVEWSGVEWSSAGVVVVVGGFCLFALFRSLVDRSGE